MIIISWEVHKTNYLDYSLYHLRKRLVGIWTLTETADKEMTYLSKEGIKTSQSSSFPQEPTQNTILTLQPRGDEYRSNCTQM